jgi:hypothetical protein
MAESDARMGREQQGNTEEAEQSLSRREAASHEDTIASACGAERERIARAIMGEGEFLSEELKEFLKEIEELHGLAAGRLA